MRAYLTIEQIAAASGVSVERLWRLIDRGICPLYHWPLAKPEPVFSEDSLDTWREILSSIGSEPTPVGEILPTSLQEISLIMEATSHRARIEAR